MMVKPVSNKNRTQITAVTRHVLTTLFIRNTTIGNQTLDNLFLNINWLLLNTLDDNSVQTTTVGRITIDIRASIEQNGCTGLSLSLPLVIKSIHNLELYL